ncbi:ABC transporter ATP-binding protein [Brevundimonas naejangsanensis]|uniref:ABC transporter ATP-binding protein n=1 Tax=Brevundimonas naejangsanensis TaxID=588932 RepID=UPI0032085C0A
MKDGVQAWGVGRNFSSREEDVVALVDVSLSLTWGQFVVVQGPSGCGKSTLLNLLGLLDRPSVGRLNIAGVPVHELSEGGRARLRRAEIGYLFQDAGLIERMRAIDNVEAPLAYRGVPRGQRRATAEAALRELGLSHRLRALTDTLSGGERQRVGLARILAQRPRLIICDEPTASLDEANSRLVAARLMQLAEEGALVVCASHDPIVIELAQRRIELSHGRLKTIADGPP